MKKNDAFPEIVVGVFLSAVLALLAYFTIVVSGVDVLRGRHKVVASVAFDDVGGLKDHDSVMYRGTKVGAVDRIDLTPSNLVVRIEIDGGVVLREKYRIAVCSLSMLGGNYLLLEEGDGAALPLETTLFAGETPTDWMRDISEIAGKLREITSNGELAGMVSNMNAITEKVRSLADRVERGEGTVGKLLSSDETIYNDLKATAAGAKEIVGRVERGEGTLGKLLSADDTVYNDLKRTAASAADISGRISKGEGVLGRLVAKDDPLGAELDAALASFRAACDSLDTKEISAGAKRLLASLEETAEKLKTGEGTLGRLVNDSSLYEEILSLAKDVRQVLDNYRDTTPITTFGSLVTGAL